MRSYGGKILAERMHLERLFESAKGAGASIRWTRRQISSWLRARVRQSGYRDAYVRLTAVLPAQGGDALVLFVRRLAPQNESFYKKGVRVKVSPWVRSSHKAFSPQVKSNQYLNAVMARLAPGPDAFEILFLNAQGFLTEGSVSNMMLVKGGEVLTPPVSAGILSGVTRYLVAEALAKEKIPFRETHLTRHDLYAADEAFLTTSLSEIVPIASCDGRKVGVGRQGALTRRIHAAYKALVPQYLERIQ